MQCPICNKLRYSREWKPSQWKQEKAVTDRFNCCKDCNSEGVFSEGVIAMGRDDVVTGAIQCPICNTLSYKSQWKPSQWKHGKAVTDRFNCCKDCNSEGVYATTDDVVTAFRELQQARKDITKVYPGKQGFDDFIVDWMTNKSALERKNLSYHGNITGDRMKTLVPQTPSGERQHFALPPDGFDCGNWTYSAGMKMISTSLVIENGWNQETVGDIWESILGYRKLHPAGDQMAINIANWADPYMLKVHTFVFLAQALDWDTFAKTDADWVSWTSFVKNVKD
jgi:hypothetical protein